MSLETNCKYCNKLYQIGQSNAIDPEEFCSRQHEMQHDEHINKELSKKKQKITKKKKKKGFWMGN